MKKIIFPILLISTLLIFNKCSTDFDIYADYKDITIVYGIMDISDDTSWIKITKAFTGPGNALLIAQNPDSSNYSYKLDVTLNGKKGNIELDPIVFDTITIHNKALTDTVINENGDTTFLNPFYSPDQLVYYAVAPLDKDAEYTLVINKKDEQLTASTHLVDNFSIIKPNNRITFPKSTTTPDPPIEWRSANNGKSYEVSLRFKYLELAPGYPDTLHKSVDWPLGVVNSKTTDGGEELVKTYSGPGFYALLESNLDSIPNVERWTDSVDITIACGSQVLATYLDINSAEGSLLEEVPVYSNIVGGTGVFASRHTIMRTLRLSFVTERTLVEDYDLGFKLKSK